MEQDSNLNKTTNLTKSCQKIIFGVEACFHILSMHIACHVIIVHYTVYMFYVYSEAHMEVWGNLNA